ncbi:MAG: VWA domain-containing protein [Lentimicrobium sp.]|nr:VWA domain-containing protein [Lentimicrobium sp.]
MKKNYLLCILLCIFANSTFAHGVAVVNATTGIYLRVESSNQSVMVYDQVATIVSTQVFRNQTGATTAVKYAFPLHEEASATSLRWMINNTWYTAIFAPSPQDTSLPGGGDPDPELMAYLGDSPLFFDIPDLVAADSSIVIEITYVELLPYNFSLVEFDYPNDYSLIQSYPFMHHSLDLQLESQRTIESIELVSHPSATIINTGHHAEIHYEHYEVLPNTDFYAEYLLNAEELGLFSFSTYLPDSLSVCDNYGNGFFTFIVEPDPADSTQVIEKVFTLIIDRSGSMTGNKMEQAKDAAAYIVENLNEGDYFNIVEFDGDVSSFMPDHVAWDQASKQNALNYINTLYARGMTNISGAFQTAIEDFAYSDTTQANIIIFFTDGEATAGLTGTQQILDYIQDQQTYYQVNGLIINTFGIGDYVNQALLSQIASQNNGLCEFLLDNELEQMITQFYMKIRNPVLLNITMTFDPPITTETYPSPLPNLYLGQQLIVSGRYDLADSVAVTLSGNAFGISQTYTYNMYLTDSLITNNMFLTKLWAKRKIDYLYTLYFTFDEGSPEAEEIREEIVEISTCYNVSSPFTHFSGGGGGGGTTASEYIESTEDEVNVPAAYPNPFTGSATIRFTVESGTEPGYAQVLIFDVSGRLICTLGTEVNQAGNYEIFWNGCDQNGIPVKPGFYTFRISLNGKNISGSMMKVK